MVAVPASDTGSGRRAPHALTGVALSSAAGSMERTQSGTVRCSPFLIHAAIASSQSSGMWRVEVGGGLTSWPLRLRTQIPSSSTVTSRVCWSWSWLSRTCRRAGARPARGRPRGARSASRPGPWCGWSRSIHSGSQARVSLHSPSGEGESVPRSGNTRSPGGGKKEKGLRRRGHEGLAGPRGGLATDGTAVRCVTRPGDHASPCGEAHQLQGMQSPRDRLRGQACPRAMRSRPRSVDLQSGVMAPTRYLARVRCPRMVRGGSLQCAYRAPRLGISTQGPARGLAPITQEGMIAVHSTSIARVAGAGAGSAPGERPENGGSTEVRRRVLHGCKTPERGLKTWGSLVPLVVIARRRLQARRTRRVVAANSFGRGPVLLPGPRFFT